MFSLAAAQVNTGGRVSGKVSGGNLPMPCPGWGCREKKRKKNKKASSRKAVVVVSGRNRVSGERARGSGKPG